MPVPTEPNKADGAQVFEYFFLFERCRQALDYSVVDQRDSVELGVFCLEEMRKFSKGAAVVDCVISPDLNEEKFFERKVSLESALLDRALERNSHGAGKLGVSSKIDGNLAELDTILNCVCHLVDDDFWDAGAGESGLHNNVQTGENGRRVSRPDRLRPNGILEIHQSITVLVCVLGADVEPGPVGSLVVVRGHSRTRGGLGLFVRDVDRKGRFFHLWIFRCGGLLVLVLVLVLRYVGEVGRVGVVIEPGWWGCWGHFADRDA